MDGLEFLESVAGVEATKGVLAVMISTEGSEALVVEALPLVLEVISASPSPQSK